MNIYSRPMANESRLKELRIKAKLTQEELCKKVGVSRTILVSWECDFGSASVSSASKLANFFGVSIEYLAGKENKALELKLLKEAIKNVDLDELAEFIAKHSK